MVVHTGNPSVSGMQENCVFGATLGYTEREVLHGFASFIASSCILLHIGEYLRKMVHTFLYLYSMFSYSV